MSLRNTPNRNNKVGMWDRLDNNTDKPCTVSYCYERRNSYSGYCTRHKYNLYNYGDTEQHNISTVDLSPFYKETLKYIEEHMEELQEHLELANRLIKSPDLIRNHDMSSVEQWLKPKTYKDKGYLLNSQTMDILHRWRDTRKPKHFLAAIIAPHVFSWQRPNILLSGKPVQMLMSKQLLSNCRQKHYFKEISSLNYKKERKSNYVSPKQRIYLGLRLTNMFRRCILSVAKSIPELDH